MNRFQISEDEAKYYFQEPKRDAKDSLIF